MAFGDMRSYDKTLKRFQTQLLTIRARIYINLELSKYSQQKIQS